MIAAVAVAAFVVLIQRRIGLEVGTGEVIQQHFEADIEEVAPAAGQMSKQSLFVSKQPIMATIQHVWIGEALIGAEQIAQRGAAVPFPV